MTTILYFVPCSLAVFLALFIFANIRNENVLKTRLAFVDDDALYPAAYRKLPSYNQMCLHPKHWGRWTKAQWVAWVEK